MADRWLCCGRQVQLAMRQMQRTVAIVILQQDKRTGYVLCSAGLVEIKKFTKGPLSDTQKYMLSFSSMHFSSYLFEEMEITV